MVQPSTLAEFLFMMAFISAWHTYMYFVSSLDKERKVFKRAPRCYCILILWGFSPGQLLIRAPPERIDIWSLWENVNDYLGNPLYPMPTILLSSLTIHAPTCTGILDSSVSISQTCLPVLQDPCSSWRRGRTLQGSTRTTPGILPGAVRGALTEKIRPYKTLKTP